MPAIPRIAKYKTAEALRDACAARGIAIPIDDAPLAASDSPMQQPIDVAGFAVGNRWAIHPMEGWDGTPDGKPTDNTFRRWRHFGESGAKLIWGGEAVAVRHDGRANPNQLYFKDANPPESEAGLAQLRQTLVDAHNARFGEGASDDLLIGLQLTHSGRFSRPNDKATLEPRIAYRHPILDARAGITDDNADTAVLTDDELYQLIDDYIAAAKTAQNAGFQFVDIKHCHGYLGHELLSAYDRPGDFGGSLENRTRLLRLICEGIQRACPGLVLGVRLSAFDHLPHKPDQAQSKGGRLGPGIPEDFKGSDYPGFGLSRDNPGQIDLTEPIALLKLMRDALNIAIVNLTAGSPYYNPHLQRPAYFPPSDGYQPPEDPLLGCLRQIDVVRQLRAAVPDLAVVGTAYTYFQEYLPHAAQALVRDGWVDFVGLGRMALSYWDLPADAAEGKPIDTKRLCRTFSDCTTAPRNGIISGCYPLDDHYKLAPEHDELKAAKKDMIAKLKILNQ